MLRGLTFAAIILLCGAANAYWKGIASAPAQTYFVSTSGSDSNNGTSSVTPWQTIGHVNAQSFAAGSTVQFDGGQTFSGSLALTATSLTVQSYGTGQATISSGNSTCVTATNSRGFTFQNIICTGGGDTTNATNGIYVLNNQAGNTALAGPKISGNTVTGYGASGIFVFGANGNSGFSGTTISNNIVHDTSGNGGIFSACIRVDGSATGGYSQSNVTVSGNLAYDCIGQASQANWTGSGIGVFQTQTALMEFNVAHDFGASGNECGGPVGIWSAGSDSVTIQFNEAYNGSSGGGGGCDGDGFDFDGSVTNSVMQYNYAHGNQGAGILLFAYSGSGTWSNNTARYNVLENNGGTNLSDLTIETQGPSLSGVYAYNNTMYNA
jgi:hypothetical protein